MMGFLLAMPIHNITLIATMLSQTRGNGPFTSILWLNPCHHWPSHTCVFNRSYNTTYLLCGGFGVETLSTAMMSWLKNDIQIPQVSTKTIAASLHQLSLCLEMWHRQVVLPL